MPIGNSRTYRGKASYPRIASFVPVGSDPPTRVPGHLEEHWEGPRCSISEFQSAALALESRTMAKDDGKCLKNASQMLAAELRAYAVRNRARWQSVCLPAIKGNKQIAEKLSEVEAASGACLMHPHAVIDLVRSCPSSRSKQDRMRYATLSCLADGIYRSDACMAKHLRRLATNMLGTDDFGCIGSTLRTKCITCDLSFDRRDCTHIDVANGCCLRELECSGVFSILGSLCFRRDARVVKVLTSGPFVFLLYYSPFLCRQAAHALGAGADGKVTGALRTFLHSSSVQDLKISRRVLLSVLRSRRIDPLVQVELQYCFRRADTRMAHLDGLSIQCHAFMFSGAQFEDWLHSEVLLCFQRSRPRGFEGFHSAAMQDVAEAVEVRLPFIPGANLQGPVQIVAARQSVRTATKAAESANDLRCKLLKGVEDQQAAAAIGGLMWCRTDFFHTAWLCKAFLQGLSQQRAVCNERYPAARATAGLCCIQAASR